MILSKSYWTKNTSKLVKENHNYVVIDVEHFQYHHEQKRFEYTIQIMDVCNTLRNANDMYKKLGINKSFNFNILYDVAKATVSEEPFNNKQIKEYYKLMAEIEVFAIGIQSFYGGTDSLMIDTEVELLLLGVDHNKQSKLLDIDEKGQHHDDFHNLRGQVLTGDKSVDVFINEVADLIENTLRQANKDNDREAA